MTARTRPLPGWANASRRYVVGPSPMEEGIITLGSNDPAESVVFWVSFTQEQAMQVGSMLMEAAVTGDFIGPEGPAA